jgi:predicted transcriptional regulator
MTATSNLIRELTADILSAYTSNNPVAREDLPDVVARIATALASLGMPKEREIPVLTPPISIKKSVTPEYIVSLEDGKHYKSMKRHLGGRGLTPDEYREKWGLPRDYPMVAPNYAAARSALAKKMGLGRKAAPVPEPVKAKRGRKAK